MSDGTPRRVSNEPPNAEWERSRTNSNTTTGNESTGKRLFDGHPKFLEDIKYRSVQQISPIAFFILIVCFFFLNGRIIDEQSLE